MRACHQLCTWTLPLANERRTKPGRARQRISARIKDWTRKKNPAQGCDRVRGAQKKTGGGEKERVSLPSQGFQCKQQGISSFQESPGKKGSSRRNISIGDEGTCIAGNALEGRGADQIETKSNFARQRRKIRWPIPLVRTSSKRDAGGLLAKIKTTKDLWFNEVAYY